TGSLLRPYHRIGMEHIARGASTFLRATDVCAPWRTCRVDARTHAVHAAVRDRERLAFIVCHACRNGPCACRVIASRPAWRGPCWIGSRFGHPYRCIPERVPVVPSRTERTPGA